MDKEVIDKAEEIHQIKEFKDQVNQEKNPKDNQEYNEQNVELSSKVKLTEEELNDKLAKSTKLKEDGNVHFKNEEFDRSLALYGEALKELEELSIGKFDDKKSIILNNRAICKWKLLEKSNPDNLDLKDEKIKLEFEDIINDLTKSIELNPTYFKPYLKRAELNHKFGEDRLDSSLEDYKKLLELIPSDNRKLLNDIKYEIFKLEKEIEERNEKLKQEMLSKLKDLGNLVLRPFGLSTDNFKLQQNENGGYSVNFQ